MLLELRDDLLRRLYAHAECEHEVLLQALIAYKMPKPDYTEIHAMIGTMNEFTKHAWALETYPY